jgi:hypothetical protein
LDSRELAYAQGRTFRQRNRRGQKSEHHLSTLVPPEAASLDSNVQRWLRQFQSAPNSEKVETKTIGGRKTTLVSTSGTFSSGYAHGSQRPRLKIMH